MSSPPSPWPRCTRIPTAAPLRSYRLHAQAVVLASHARSHLQSLARGDLARADQTLQRAVWAAENAVDLWPDWPAGRTTVTRTVDLTALGSAENTGLRFQGFLTVATTARYSFALASDDGSRLIIDGTVVVDNDGLHDERTRSGAITLAAGAHQVTLLYFQAAGGSALHLEMSAPGIAPAEIPAAWWTH